MRKSILVMDDEVSTAITAPGGHGVARCGARSRDGGRQRTCRGRRGYVLLFYVLHNCCYNYLLIGWNTFFKHTFDRKYFVCWTLCFIVDFPPDTLLRSKLSPGTLYFEVNCPPDTLLRSKLSPHKGDNLLHGGLLSFEVKCQGRTVCFEVKCPWDS